MNPAKKVPIAVAASGDGSIFEALTLAGRADQSAFEVAALLCDRTGAGALGRAERLGVSARVLAPRDFPNREAWDHAFAKAAGEFDRLVLAGFLSMVGAATLARLPERIVNTHPALLPKFGGRGMYGERVHRAVLATGELETGVTFHVIDEHFDRGRILRQARVSVAPSDDAHSLAERVKHVERDEYPRAISDWIRGQI